MPPKLIKRIGFSFLFLGLIFFVLEILFAYYIPSHSFVGAVIFNLGFFYRDFVTVLLGTSIVFLISGFGTAFIGHSIGKKKKQQLISAH